MIPRDSGGGTKRAARRRTRRSTPTQVRQARVQARQYKSQAGAVRRAAKTQARLGPGVAVRPPGRRPVLHARDIEREVKRRAPYHQEAAHRYTPTVIDPWKGREREVKRRKGLNAKQRRIDPQIRAQGASEGAHALLHRGGGAYGSIKTGTLFALEQLMRPSAGIGSALRERTEGGSSLGSRASAFSEGFLHPSKHAADWSKAVENIGVKNPVLREGIALTGAIATDPLTWVTGGTAAPARAAAMHTLRRELAAGASHADAARAARAVYDAAPAASKHAGPTIGVRHAGMSRPLTLGKTKVAAKGAAEKLGIRTRPVVGPAARKAAGKLSANVRPAGVSPIDWELVKRAGTAGRAGEREAWRHGEARAAAYRKLTEPHPGRLDRLRGRPAAAAIPAARQVHILQTAEDIHPTWSPERVDAAIAAANLSDNEATVLRNILEERNIQHAKEPARAGLTPTSRVGVGARPRRPEPAPGTAQHEVRQLQRTMRAAAKERKAAERAHLKLMEGRGAQGVRSAAAVKQLQKTPNPSLEAGAAAAKAVGAVSHLRQTGKLPDYAKGVSAPAQVAKMAATDEALAQATARVNAARLGEHTAIAAYKAGATSRGAAAHANRAAEREWQRSMADWERAPRGYVPRRAAQGVILPDVVARQPKGAGARVGGPSYLRRKGSVRLADMAPEDLAKLETDIPRLMGQRAVEHGRIMSTADLNNRIAGLGNAIPGHAARAAVGAKRMIYQRDERGFMPAFDKEGRVDREAVEHAIVQGHELVEVNPALAESVRSLARGNRVGHTQDVAQIIAKGEGVLEDRGGGLRRTTRMLKWWQTAPNPSYHIRNIVGDSFNAVLGGASVGDFRRAGYLRRVEAALKRMDHELKGTPGWQEARDGLAKASGRVEHYKGVGGPLSDLDVIQLASRYGAIRTGITSGELRAAQQGKGIAEQGRVTGVREKIQAVGDWREDLVRLASFRGALKRGMDPEAAAQHALAHHFDYSNLTPLEQRLRDFIPFWTFMARNTPLQAKKLVQRPGTFANVEKARQASLMAAGQDPDLASNLAEFEQQNPPWGTGIKAGGLPVTASPALPYMDLSNIPLPAIQAGLGAAGVGPGYRGGKAAAAWEGASNLIGRTNPLIKTPFELTSGFNTFTGQKYNAYNTGSRVPAPAWWPRDLTTPIRDKRTGKMVPGIPWQALAAIRVAPASNLASKAGVPGPPGSPAPLAMAAAGWLTGPRYVAQNERAIRLNQVLARAAQLDKLAGDMGQTVPGHKAGDKWEGEVGKVRKQALDLKHEAYRLSKKLGYANPLGVKPPKGRHRKPKGLGGFGGGGFGGGGFGGEGFGP